MRIDPRKIMCAIDFSEFSNSVLTFGQALAHRFDAPLVLCHVVPGQVMVHSHFYVDFNALEMDHARQVDQARERLETLAADHDVDARIIIRSGYAADELAAVASDEGIDLVICATHGLTGIKRFLIGSVTERLLKILHCPLFVLHDRPEADPCGPLRKILVGCDFSEDSRMAVNYGLSLAQEFEAELHLVHVIRAQMSQDDQADQLMRLHSGDLCQWYQSMDHSGLQNKKATLPDEKHQMISRIQKRLTQLAPEECRHWCTPVTVLLEGEPHQELIRYADSTQIDVIVLGIRGHSLLEQFFVGSTTDRVVSRANRCVLAVRPEI